MKDENGVTLIMCRVGGDAPPDGVVRLDITALANTPDHIREFLVRDGIDKVKREYPTAEDVKLIEDWGEFEFAPADDQEQEGTT